MKISQKLLSRIAWSGSILSFLAFVVFVLLGLNSEVLFTAHDRSSFIGGALFFHELASKPFGFLQYAGAWLTQLFYYPALGASVLVAIWALIFVVGAKAFKLKGINNAVMLLPIACLAVSIVHTGYWIYTLYCPGYWFSQSLGYLIMLLLLWRANAFGERQIIVWHLLIGFVAYPLLGWFSILFSVCYAFSHKPRWYDAVGIIFAMHADVIWHAIVYPELNVAAVSLAGLPVFETSTDSDPSKTIPFYILAVLSALIPLFALVFRKHPLPEKILRLNVALPVLCAAIGMYFVWALMYNDKNYIDEMRMVRLTETDDWQGVVSVAEQSEHPTRTMVMLKNIALMNTGELLDRSFVLGNDGVEITNPDSLNVNIMQIAAPLIYYNYGRMNYSTRWCFEFAVSKGMTPFHLKLLSRAAVARGENKLAAKYNSMLRTNMFYQDWIPAPPTAIVKAIQRTYIDAIDSDQNSCERYLLDMFCRSYGANNITVLEQALFYSMLLRSNTYFWPALNNYLRHYRGKTLPLHVQEAYVLFAQGTQGNPPIRLNVDPKIVDDYKTFYYEGMQCAKYGMEDSEIAESLRGKWGGTYWWFNGFGRSEY